MKQGNIRYVSGCEINSYEYTWVSIVGTCSPLSMQFLVILCMYM